MEPCEEIKTNVKVDLERSILPFLKQLFICSSVIMNFLIFGLYMGAITVTIPQIRKAANSTDAISSETASWLSSLPVISALPWLIILPFLAERYGRKLTLIIVNISVLICNLIHYLSTTVTGLIIGQVVEGILISSVSNISIMVMTEYISPKYRGYLFTFKSATFFWGIWISNAIGTFYSYKNIYIIIFICCIYNFITIFYPESPYWLASRQRFSECSKVHRWLKGKGKDSEKELKMLIASHQRSEEDDKYISLTNNIFRMITRKIFYKPVIFSTLALCLYHFSGKLVYSIYAIDIFKKITASEKSAYECMLIIDAVTILGMYVGCILTKFMKRRTQLLSFGVMGISFLYTMSLYLLLVKLKVIDENKYVSLLLLSGFSLSSSCGSIIMSICCHGELTPLKDRFSYFCITSILSCMLASACLKMSPTIFLRFGTDGAFLFYALSSTVFIYLLYKYLPETKDKTIQEIEMSMADKSIDKKECESIPLKSIDCP